jgi:putative ATP-binding cassette transporter
MGTDFYHLLKKEIKEPVRPIIAFIALSGIVNALLIAIINIAAENASNSEVNTKFLFLFVIGVMIVIFSKKYILDKTGLIVESTMYRIRNRIADRIRNTELNTLEAIGTSVIYARITQDASSISITSLSLANSVQAVIMIVFTMLYIASISLLSFLVIVVVIGMGAITYSRYSRSFQGMWRRMSVKEAAFFDSLSHILTGFKEIKINRSKNEEVYKNYTEVSKSLKDIRIETALSYNVLKTFIQVFVFMLLGFVLFLLPQIDAEHSEDVIKVTAAVLFIVGPFEAMVHSLQHFDSANNATRNIMALEKKLEEILTQNKLRLDTQNAPESYEMLPFVENIQLQELSYSYPPTDGHTFTISLDKPLTFKKGELIFITGGNGSGKSTFLKILTGLYPPDSGSIVVDADLEDRPGIVVTAQNYQQYRNLYSTIFTDFHLFDKLYGVEEIDPRQVNKLLENMGLLQEKITYKDGAFTNLRLSTGQKKRLALASCIIEDKPIYVFDEVAADLDPDFRDKYYYEIIQELKERNKMVIVVSHDRHYWTVPDRLLEMENGKISVLDKDQIDSLLALNK